MKDKLLVCTFSGGRTSAFMGQFLNNYDKYKNYDKVFLFANTGKEKEETLDFIDKCDKEWSLGVVWLEAKINKEKGKGTDFKVVDFKTASRNGEPFEEMLKAYPIPTVFASNCTRELKQTPINKYVKNLGYKKVITAMGIRYDERHRKSNTAKQQNIIYPLCDDIKVDSSFIRYWWDKQCFDLDLKDYEGNCDLCFKKSLRKRLTLIKENPSIAKWWLDMENKYSSEKLPRFDLRNNFSIEQLIELSKQPFKVVKDKHDINKQQASLFNDLNMDIETDCFCKAT
tara:strand:- start:741 stop:1592 length:852 start_codon:yes stop_codon:yes gene_type:complete